MLMITYEQPLNEIIRVCLRLEQLFQQIDHQSFDLKISYPQILEQYPGYDFFVLCL